MKPYYDHGGITIYHGDCREIMPSIPMADLVVTDPPYGMGYQSNRRAVKHDKIHGDESFPSGLIQEAIGRSTRAAYVFCHWRYLNLMPAPSSVIVWIKNVWGSGDLDHSHAPQWEACCFYPKEGHKFIKRPSDVIDGRRTGNTLHQTEKPVEVMAQIISCNVGDTILDPFMGSGTTLRAAKDLGRKAIGIELEEKYCEISAGRLAQEILF